MPRACTTKSIQQSDFNKNDQGKSNLISHYNVEINLQPLIFDLLLPPKAPYTPLLLAFKQAA